MVGSTSKRVLVVVNAAARGGAEELAGDVAQRCGRWAGEVVTARPRDREGAPHEVARLVCDEGPWDAVVAVGGDGTIRAVAEGLARALGRFPGRGAEPAAGRAAPPAMLVVPGGTGNSMYRALWADRPWPEVVDEALGGGACTRDFDLLRIVESGAAVLLGASAGLLADAVRIAEGLTELNGRQRYEVAAVTALGDSEPFDSRVTLGGSVLHEGPTTLVVVGGARHRAGTFQLLPRSVLDDGLLDVCVVGGMAPDAFAELAGAVVAGEHLDRPGVAYGTGRSVTVERLDGAPLGFEHDGDLWTGDDRSLTVEVVPAAVPVYAPRQPVAG